MVKICKISIIASISILFALIFFNNASDYGTNYAYVKNVLEMTDVFSKNVSSYRAIYNPYIHHLFYLVIIIVELLVAITLAYSAIRMFKYRNNEPKYKYAKQWAIVGLTLSVLLYGFAFSTIGAEWFYSWQSKTWNSKHASASLLAYCMLSMIFISNDCEDKL